MNISLQLKCPACGALRTQRVHLNDPALDFTCSRCGDTWHGLPGLDVTVGALILARSWYELQIEGDYDMAIVLAATALDCELSWLFCKWKKIEALTAGRDFSAEDCEKELRRMGNVEAKIGKVSAMLCQGGLDQFVADSDSWKDTVNKHFPSLHVGSLGTDFQQAVFRPRNKVLHQGNVSHTQADAARCYSIAELGIRILKNMDKAKLSSTGL